MDPVLTTRTQLRTHTASEQAKLFEEFSQADRTTAQRCP
jgi:hypothetical protein